MVTMFSATRYSFCLTRLSLVVGALLAVLLSSCSSSRSKLQGVPSSLPSIGLYGQARTPPHRMPRADYPFDANGNYVTAWAAEGRSAAGASSSYRSSRSHVEEDPPEPPRRSVSVSSSRSRSNVASAPPVSKKKSSTVAATPPKPAASSKSAAPSAKKSTSGGTTHTVRSNDSLWSLAKKYGTTVEKIKAANGIKGTNIRDGAKLKIPN